MSRFDFTLKHVPETKIEKMDRLSKRLDSIEKNNENQTLIKEQWICSLGKVVIEGPEVDIIEIARSKDKEVVRVVEEIKKEETKVLRGDK